MKAVLVFVMSFMVALLPDVSSGVGQSNATIKDITNTNTAFMFTSP